jgi:pyrroline-5-carboxylate reductase
VSLLEEPVGQEPVLLVDLGSLLKGNLGVLGIGPLHQPDLRGHLGQTLQVGRGPAEVGLDGEPQAGEVPPQQTEDLDGVRDVSGLLHVDLDDGVDRLSFGGQETEVVDAGALVEREAELGGLHGHCRVDPGLCDPLDRGQVLVRRRPRAGRIGHSLTQQVEDAADVLGIELADRFDRIVEMVSGYESLDDTTGELALGDHPMDPVLLRSPQQRTTEHGCLPLRPPFRCMIDSAMPRLAVLGAGKMGEALIGGLLASGWRKPEDVIVTARREDRIKELEDAHGVEATLENAKAVAGAEVVVLAVKPQDMETLLAEISAHITPDQTILSVVAAIPTEFIETRLGSSVPVVRAMPNTPSVVHEGMAGIAAGKHADESHLKIATDVLGHVGRVVTVPESYLDAVTAISGSGPAYFALLAEAMIEAGILLGLSREISTELVIQTMLGSAKLLRDTHMHPVELREMVTSPGGTTTRAIQVLEQSGVRAAFLNAIQAAMERAQELAQGEPEA